MRWRWTLIGLILFNAFLAFGQTPTADSIYIRFEQQFENALQVSPDSAFLVGEQALSSSTIEATTQFIQKRLAILHRDLGNLQYADSLFSVLLPWFKASGQHVHTLEIYSSIGRIKQQTGALIDGLAAMEEAQDFIATHEDELQSPTALLTIGMIYRVTGILFAIQSEIDGDIRNQSSAESYFRRSYTYFSKAGDPVLEGLALFNIGNIKATEDSTIFYWKKALDIFEANGLVRQKFNVYQNMAILYIDKGDYNEGLGYLQQTEALLKDRADPYDLSLLKVKYGKAYLGLKQYTRSIDYLNEGLDIAQEANLISIEGEAYELLLQAYTGTGRYQQALETYVKYDTLLRRYEKLETERIFRETEARFKTKEQEDQIQILQQTEALNEARIRQQRLVIIGVIIGLLLIALLSYFLWKRGKERQLINAQLKKLDEARTRFLVNISHELRTPITLIHAPLQDAQEQLKKGDHVRVKNDLQKIANNTTKLIRLTEEVLDIAKLDEEVLTLDLKTVELSSLLVRMFYAFESLAQRNGISWQNEVDIAKGNYEVDASKLEKILNNLLSNAIKHTPAGGTVALAAQVENEHLLLTVKDTGKGIPESSLQHVFDRYYQVNGEDKGMGGLGIGLAFVHELLEFMGGTIGVESQVGQGTRFTVKLPIRQSELPVEIVEVEDIELSLEKRPEVALGSQERPHILTVEDNPEMADFIQQLFSDEYQVTMAGNGLEALERLKSQSFDLMTVDVMMPEMDGHSLVKQLKANSQWKQIPLVMITALSGEADKVEGLHLGVDDYIPKPFGAGELLARVRNLLHNARERKLASQESPEPETGEQESVLHKAQELVESKINQSELSVKDLADHLNLSERQANRVIKKLTGLSCLQFIREVRLQKAYRLLEGHQYKTIAEVAYAVGFENPSYFTRLFTERYGKKPSEML